MSELSLNARLGEIKAGCESLARQLDSSGWVLQHVASRIEKLGQATADAAAQLARDGFPGKADELDNLWRRLKQQTQFYLAADALDPEKRGALIHGQRRCLQHLGRAAGSILKSATGAVEDSPEAARHGEQESLLDADTQPLTKAQVAALLYMQDQFPALCTLDDFDSATPTSLSRRTATTVCKALIAAGYAQRPRERQGITLTKEGQRIAAKLRARL